MKKYIIALDQGTTSSRAIIFDTAGNIEGASNYALTQYYPQPGWVEHDPEEILAGQIGALREAYMKSGVKAHDIAALGVTNQRETVIIWNKKTGKPIHNAIVWQCRRTADICSEIREKGAESYIKQKTGLVIDAYFSGTKIKWLLDNIPGARRDAQNGKLLCGTVDSWLIWNLTGGRAHVSDYSNASRTMLFDINRLCWDEDILKLFGIPSCMLPRPVESSEEYGRIAKGIAGIEELAGIPICGAAGDQAAALFGQACFEEGQAKNTYGTGCFTLMNVGDKPVFSSGGLVTSVAWSIKGKKQYALEGSVFNAGSSIQWLRDELGLIKSAPECDRLAESVENSGGVYMVSAFTGLGAPYWDMYARGAIVGLTRGTTKAQIARAVLEGIAYQVYDLMDTMQKDSGRAIKILKVDGGASRSDILMQFQSSILGIDVDRPKVIETTALGAAYLAGLAAGIYGSTDDIARLRERERLFTPEKNKDYSAAISKWHRAVERAMEWEKE